jgi:hypothetical protein
MKLPRKKEHLFQPRDDGLKNCCFFLSLQQLSSFVTPAIFKPGPKLFKEENIWIPDKSA